MNADYFFRCNKFILNLCRKASNQIMKYNCEK